MKKHSSVLRNIVSRALLPSCVALFAATAAAAVPETTQPATAQPGSSPTGLPTINSIERPDDRAQQSVQRSGLPRAMAAGAAAKDAFQTFVETTTGNALPVFGRELFSGSQGTYAPTEVGQVNQDYVIGAGDELQIRGWGMIDVDVSATVDRSGAVYIPRVGSVKVAGVKYRDLQGYLKKAIGKNFSGFDLTVSVAQTRAVQVYVVGHAARPGTYNLSAMSTLLNALFSSGGPSASGTMRNIEVKRGGQTITTFDLYDMMVKGDKTRDIQLQDGDVIYIPEVGPMVALTGNVKTPAIYELKGQSSLADLVGWAGGFDSAAENKQVIVERNVNNTFKTEAVLEADRGVVASQLSAIALRPADVLRVFAPGAVPIEAQIENEYVSVVGELRQTGVIKLHKGETLKGLITRLGGVTDDGYLYAMQFRRESVRRAQQAKLDEVADRFERDTETNTRQRLASTTDKDNAASILADEERVREQAARMRQIRAEGRVVLELADGGAQVQNLPDLQLHDGDTIYVPRKPGTVNVLGAVFQQNSFIFKPQRTVDDYLKLAGGATVTADSDQIYLIRADGTAQSSRSGVWFKSFSSSEVNPGDTVVVPEKLDRTTWTQTFKEWTTILYQFGLGAAGLKVLKN